MKNKLTYELKITEDGSNTLHSPLFGEDCHSSYGAKTETLIYYIQGCKIRETLEALSTINILEVGFGTGLGLRTTFEETKNINGKVKFVSLELDRDLLNYIFSLDHFADFRIEEERDKIFLSRDNFSAEIIIGDARQTLPIMKHEKFHGIYQDAFSPKRNPMLWTVQWFKDLRDAADENCILSTYSASSSIRKSLMEAGWIVKNGLKFSGKRSSTIATIKGNHDQDIIDHLKRSPVPLIWDETADEFSKMR
jgi:tRNA U34 5-methylaminomethyl-2-thiouridine-forming methyltransferase MnmC